MTPRGFAVHPPSTMTRARPGHRPHRLRVPLPPALPHRATKANPVSSDGHSPHPNITSTTPTRPAGLVRLGVRNRPRRGHRPSSSGPRRDQPRPPPHPRRRTPPAHNAGQTRGGFLTYRAASYLDLKEAEPAAAADQSLLLARRIGAPRCITLVTTSSPTTSPTTGLTASRNSSTRRHSANGRRRECRTDGPRRAATYGRSPPALLSAGLDVEPFRLHVVPVRGCCRRRAHPGEAVAAICWSGCAVVTWLLGWPPTGRSHRPVESRSVQGAQAEDVAPAQGAGCGGARERVRRCEAGGLVEVECGARRRRAQPARRASRIAAATPDGSSSASRPTQCGWSLTTRSVIPGASACSTANEHGDQARPWKYAGLPRRRQR